jgi:hypothetical protein
MIPRTVSIVIAVALALPLGSARADEEGLESHTRTAPRTIVLDNRQIQPASLDMTAADAIDFENHATQAMIVTFTDPPDMQDKIRCHLIRRTAAEKGRAAWQLFAWTNDRLSATIPPGRFASVCSLTPGSYAYTVTRQGVGARQSTSGVLPQKGQITVR